MLPDKNTIFTIINTKYHIMKRHTAPYAATASRHIIAHIVVMLLLTQAIMAQGTQKQYSVKVYGPTGLTETVTTDEGDEMDEPTAVEYEGYEPAGWSATPIIDAPHFTPLTFPLTVTSDMSIYAVYAQTSGSSAYYTEITSPDEIEDGQYIITAEKDGTIYGMENTINGSTTKPVPAIVMSQRPDNDPSEVPDNIMHFHIYPDPSGSFYIKATYNGKEYHTNANNSSVFICTYAVRWGIKSLGDQRGLLIQTNNNYESKELKNGIVMLPDGSGGWKGYSTSNPSYTVRLYRRHEIATTTSYTTIFRTTEEQEQLAPPQNIRHDTSAGKITLTWDMAEGCTEYIISIATEENSLFSQSVIRGNVNEILSPRPCLTYRISVRSIDPTNSTLSSEPVSDEITLPLTVTLDPDGGTLPEDTESTFTLECDTKTEMTLPQPDAPENKVLVGWDNLSAEEEEHIAAGETVRPEESTTFKAIWRDIKEYTMTLSINKKKQTLIYKETTAVSTIDTPEISGYKFYGWSTAEEYVHGQTPLFTFGSQLISDTVLYAMFIPEDEDITPLAQAQEADDGVYVLIQEKDGRFYALKTDGKYDGRLTTNAEEVTSYITSNEDGLLTLDISNMEGRASLLRIDRMEGEAVRIKDVATNLFISGNDNGNGLRNDRITTWLISPTGENDGSVLISSNGGRRWSVNTNELTWTSTASQSEAYTSGATYLFKTGYNSPIANGITFVTEIVQPSDTLSAPAIDITPYVNELFIEWEKVENATSYILKIPEINFSETLPSNIQSYSIGGLEPSHRYRIELQALSDNPELHNSTTVTTYASALASKDNNLVIKDITTEGITISVPEAVKNPTLHLLRHKQQTENTADDIFISKYLHGAAFTRMLSVYNGTGKDVPLGNIRIIGGKNSWSDSISLDNMGNIHCGHIAPGEEITICLYSPSSVYDKRVISMVTDSALREWFCVTGGMPQYGSDWSIALERRNDDGTWHCIDLIGATDDNGTPTDTACGRYTEGRGWISRNSTDGNGNMSDISTNSSLLIRRNHVKSGAEAAASNRGTFSTLGSEWDAYPITYPDDDFSAYMSHSAEILRRASAFVYDSYYHSGADTIETVQTQAAPSLQMLTMDVNSAACQELTLKAVSDDASRICFSQIRLPIVLPSDSVAKGTCGCDILITEEVTTDAETLKDMFTDGKPTGNIILMPGSTIDFTRVNSINIKRIITINSNTHTTNIYGYENVINQLPILPIFQLTAGGIRYLSLPAISRTADIRAIGKEHNAYITPWEISEFDGQLAAEGRSPFTAIGRKDSLYIGNGYKVTNTDDEAYMLAFHLTVGNEEKVYPQIHKNTSPDNGSHQWGWNLAGNTSLEDYIGDWAVQTIDGQIDIPYITVADSTGTNFIQERAELVTISPYAPILIQSPDSGIIRHSERQTAVSQQSVTVKILHGEREADKTTVICDEKSSKETYRIGHDLQKVSGYTTQAQIYTECKGTKLAFCSLPLYSMSSIPLGVYLPSEGNYTISLDREKSYRYRNILLTDNETGTRTDLTERDYTFTADGRKTLSGRFYLIISDTSTLSSDGQPLDSTSVVSNGNDITVHGIRSGCTVTLCDMAGKILHETETNGDDDTMVFHSMPDGVYIITIHYPNGYVHSVKVIN